VLIFLSHDTQDELAVLGRIRGARVSRKTALVIVVLALAVFVTFVYVNVSDFVPEELTAPTPTSQP
jgi:hypothetical protein